ncbi:MAG: extensin family protein [Pseudomonadota bacterium]
MHRINISSGSYLEPIIGIYHTRRMSSAWTFIFMSLVVATAPVQANASEPITPSQPPQPRPEQTAGPSNPSFNPAAYTQCIADLSALSATFTELDTVTSEDPGCGVAKPIDVDEIVPGVSVTPDTQMRCATALALAEWVNQTVIPATESLSTDENPVRLISLQHASTYVCRRSNNQPDGKLSEHAKGNAIDIRAFAFEGRDPISIEPRERTGKIEEAFQKTVRAGACLHFTTVLGPGSDGFHQDHIHLDIAERRGGYRLCQ